MPLPRSLVLLVLLLAGTFAVLNVHKLSRQIFLNYDEHTHLEVARGTASQVWAKAQAHAHPPFVFFVFRLFGEPQPHTARGLSLTFYALSLLMGFFWVRRLAGVLPALGAFIILSSAPILWHVAYQIRGYSLLLLLQFVALYCLERVGERGRFWPVAFGLTALLAGLTHFGGAIALAPLLFWYGMRFQWQHARRVLPSIALATAIPACFYALFTVQMRGVLVNGCQTYLGSSLLSCPNWNRAALLDDFPLIFVLGLPALVALAVFAFFLSRHEKWRRLEVAGLLTPAVALAVVAFLSAMGRYPLTFERHGVFLVPFLLLLPVVFLNRLHRSRCLFSYACVLALLLGIALTPGRIYELTWDHHPVYSANRLDSLRAHTPAHSFTVLTPWEYFPLAQAAGDLSGGPVFQYGSRTFLRIGSRHSFTGLCHWGKTLAEFGVEEFYFPARVPKAIQARSIADPERLPLSQISTGQFARCPGHAPLVEAFQRRCRRPDAPAPCPLKQLTARAPLDSKFLLTHDQ